MPDRLSFASLPLPLRRVAEICLVISIGLLVAFLFNTFVFRFYSVTGPSMQPTLVTRDILLVNKTGPTVAWFTKQPLVPKRLQLIVFRNPLFSPRHNEEFIVKRVIGLPGERVVVRDNHITIYNTIHPEGFDPDQTIQDSLSLPTAGNVDHTIPENELFVVGDNRIGEYSFDSRNGLSTIRIQDIEGVVLFRLLPVTRWELF